MISFGATPDKAVSSLAVFHETGCGDWPEVWGLDSGGAVFQVQKTGARLLSMEYACHRPPGGLFLRHILTRTELKASARWTRDNRRA